MNKSFQQAEVVTISTQNTIAEAATKMRVHRVACLVVTDENDDFAGVVTERDIVCRAASFLLDIKKITVDKIMTGQVISCSRDTQASEVRNIMATNRIRHLPIVEDGSVVGMFSVRDVLEQQLVEDREVTEQITALSNCLKSMDLNEVANTITVEVSKLFQAEMCVLCLHRNGGLVKGPPLVSANGCICSETDLENPGEVYSLCKDCKYVYDVVPHICETQGQAQRIVIPLNTSETSSDKRGALYGYLCLCGLDSSVANNKDLISYKAKLVRKIVNSQLNNAALYQHARLTSLIDPLTELGSRKLLEDKLDTECARAKRYKRPFSIAIIDLDNFKTINDILGHAAGDNALRQLAGCMKQNRREADILARYGGDEFVLLLPETRAQEALIFLERLRLKVEDIKIAENVSMTISCGVAEWLPETSSSASDITRKADLALYEAKSAGRNCIKVWDKTMSNQLKGDEIEEETIRKLKRRVAGLSEQSEKMFIQSIWGLVQALEAKDPYTKSHTENVMYYSLGIAETMKIAPKQIRVIRRAAMIHDIGKIGVPDSILSKPSVLTRHEHRVVEQHPLIAVNILSKMEFLEREMLIVRHHHEKWNGQGYPDGLTAASTPLGARIIAIADTLDALTSDRSYHKSRSVCQAMKIIVDSSGYEFDAKVVEGFVRWVKHVGNQLDKKIEQITPKDLVMFQKQHDDSNPASVVSELVSCNSGV